MKLKIILLALLLWPLIVFGQWTKVGDDIDGEATNDHSGFSTSLSADGNTVVIGARNNGDNGSASGQVRVYQKIDNQWVQKGGDIDGIAPGDQFGFSVSISADGNTFAAGAPDSNANGFESGQVRVFEFTESNWVQIGEGIGGEAFSDHSGYAVSLSDNGNRLAIGAPDNGLVEGVGSNYGQVRIYENDNGNWVKIGNDIDGENPEDNSGFAVSLSQDGSTVAIGAPNNSNTVDGAGHVRIYTLEDQNWVQVGDDLDGEYPFGKLGGAVSLNDEGSIVAAGASDQNGAGAVRVFEYIENSWIQIGTDMEGEAIGDQFGFSVSLNSEGNFLAVGAYYNSDSFSDAGHTRIYENKSGNWQQTYEDIDGEASQDRSGYSVSLNASGNIVAIGAYLNDGNGSNSGHVRVFRQGNTPTGITLSNNTIAENNNIGDLIGTLTTSDPDAGDTHSYTFVAGMGDADNASFSIVDTELQAAEVFDIEEKDTYSIRIKTTDATGAGFTQSFEIIITEGEDKLEQTINIEPVEDVLSTAADFDITATTTSELELSYAILSGPATIAGITVSLTGETGTVEIEVSQAGNANYLPATAKTSFVVLADSCADFSATATVIKNVSCNGGADGSIEVTVKNGTAPFNYAFDESSQDIGTFGNLASGRYEVEVTDANGCSTILPVEITAPEAITVTAETTDSNSISGNGSISLKIEGGTGEYSFSWSNGATSASLSDLELGEYTVTIVDEAGCSITESYTIGGITSNREAFTVNLFPNPVENQLEIVHGEQGTLISLLDATGRTLRKVLTKRGRTTLDITSLPSGLYFIRLENGKMHRIIKR